MIDLNMKPKPVEKKTEPEEIAMRIIAVVLWIVIVFGWMSAL